VKCTGKEFGSVTALALSHDHTYLAIGHVTGHIRLFSLNNSQAVRHVPPTTLAAVRSGRAEGHLAGSRIVSIGFIGGRHTALVSADDHGLAFYHSLGKVLFVEAKDILRILGKYPEEVDLQKLKRVERTPTNGTPAVPMPQPLRNGARRKARYTVLAMMPLPLGTAQHPTDAYNIIALLTPVKLVVVGLKPAPRTWFKCQREYDDGVKSRWRVKGTLAWFPSVSSGAPTKGNQSQFEPKLAYSWGDTLHLIRVSEKKVVHVTKNAAGKVSETELGTVIFESVAKWTSAEGDERGDDIVALQWLNPNVGSFIQSLILSRPIFSFFLFLVADCVLEFSKLSCSPHRHCNSTM
jgi:hypothetical protein